jgi:hypothetical protein
MHANLAGDTENGGFSEKSNPLLSIGLVLFDDEGTIIDTFYQRALPPEGTVMELPDNLIVDNLKYVDVYTGEFMTERGNRLVITPGAVGVNKYVDLALLKPGQWSEPTWHIGAVSYTDLESNIGEWLSSHEVTSFKAIWHNVSYDRRFVGKYLKSEHSDIDWSDEYCTMSVLRKNQVLLGVDGYSLAHLRKVAGVEVHDTKKAHTALQDAMDAYHGYMAFMEKGLQYEPPKGK